MLKVAADFDLAFHPLGAGQELNYAPRSGISKVVPAQAARIIQGLQGFDTLEGHATILCRTLGLAPQRVEQLKEQISQVVEHNRELLLTHEDLLSELQSNLPENIPSSPISSLGVPTRNRPASLARCLNSFASNAKSFAHEIEVFIMDTSDQSSAIEANLESARLVQKQFGVKLKYINRASVQSFASQLAKTAGIQQEVAQFALLNPENCPVDTGANRNVLLLASIGELTAQVDDDTVCQLAPCPDTENKLTFTSASLPTEYWFPSETGASSTVDSSLDFFELHQRLLGRSLPELLDAFAECQSDLNQVRLSFMDRSRSKRRVLVTSIGLDGDCGTASPFYSLLRLAGASRERLLLSKERYRHAIDTHQLIRCVPSFTVGDHCEVSGLNLGLDNRSFLPPFTSVQRSQDHNFSFFLFSSGAGFFGHLPYVLKHDRPVAFNYDLCTSATQILSGKILGLLVSRHVPSPHKSPEENLIDLGQSLIELGSAPDAVFEETIKMEVWDVLLGRIKALERQLTTFRRQPDYWATDVQLFLDEMRKGLADPNLHVPKDLSGAVGAEQALKLLQRITLRQGQVLTAWPRLRQCALELRKKEVWGETSL